MRDRGSYYYFANYFAELREHEHELRDLLDEAGDDTLTLLYSAKDERRNNAVALREYLTRMQRVSENPPG